MLLYMYLNSLQVNIYFLYVLNPTMKNISNLDYGILVRCFGRRQHRLPIRRCLREAPQRFGRRLVEHGHPRRLRLSREAWWMPSPHWKVNIILKFYRKMINWGCVCVQPILPWNLKLRLNLIKLLGAYLGSINLPELGAYKFKMIGLRLHWDAKRYLKTNISIDFFLVNGSPTSGWEQILRCSNENAHTTPEDSCERSETRIGTGKEITSGTLN